MRYDEAPPATLYRFHANLFVRAVDGALGPPVKLREATFSPWRATNGGPPTFNAFYQVTFEQALNALAQLPRLDAEPDGYFVVAGDQDGQRWQVDGHLYDFSDRLHRVELYGQCPPEAFDAILICLGWPATPLTFELVKEGVALEEAAFRQWASS